MPVPSALESERLSTNKKEKLSQEQISLLQGEGFYLLTYYDSEIGDMPTRVLTWAKAINEGEIRFFVDSRDRILRHLQFDQNVTLTIFGLNTVTSLLCTARSLDDNLDGSQLALIRSKIYEVRASFASGESLITQPTIAYAPLEEQRRQQYEAMVLSREE